MRIDNNGFDKAAPNGSASKTASYSAIMNGKGESAELGKSQDAVVLSDLVNLLAGANGLNNTDRASRIQQLTQQYRTGSYTVDAAALGDALMAGAFEG